MTAMHELATEILRLLYRREMALFSECRPQCAQTVLDTADIVRDGDVTTATHWTEQGGNLPLPQREVVGMGFDASCPDLVLCGLRRRGHLVNGFQCDGHFVGLGKRRGSEPRLVKMDGINLVLSRLN